MEYEYSQKKYKKFLSETSSSQYQIGEIREIFLDSKNPESVEASSSFSDLFIGPIIVSVFGLIFGFIGGLFIKSHYTRKKRKEQLLVSGVPVKASVVFAGFSRLISVDGKHPFELCAEFKVPFTNTTIFTEKMQIWYDPYLSGDIGKDNTVDVLYDRNDPKICMIVLGKSKNIKAV